MTKQKIVVHYTRNSTPQQVANKTHLVHLETINNYSNTNHFKCVREFVDKGVSGTKKERKQLIALRNYISLHEVDYVIITKLDRIMRNWMEFSVLYQELLHYQVGLIAVQQSNLDLANWDDPMVKIFVTFLALAAELEAGWIKERRDGGKEYAKIHGTKSGLPMHRPKKEFPQEQILEDWRNEASVQYLANKHKCSWKTMNNFLKENGLK